MKSGELPPGRLKSKDVNVRAKLVAAGMDAKQSEKVRDIYEGNLFIDGTRGIVQIGEIMELVLDMFEDIIRKGPVAGEPAINCMVTLMDAKLHEDAIHRGPSQMYPTVREGIRGSFLTARPVLFEPMQTLLFEAPTEYTGEISKLISNKRGQLLDMVDEGGDVQVKAKMPVADMFGLSNDLRSSTGGRGQYSLIDQTFERLPDELQQKIVGQIKSRKGMN